MSYTHLTGVRFSHRVRMDNDKLMEIIKRYAGHKQTCEALGIMWNKGPCTCGWAILCKELNLPDEAVPKDD